MPTSDATRQAHEHHHQAVVLAAVARSNPDVVNSLQRLRQREYAVDLGRDSPSDGRDAVGNCQTVLDAVKRAAYEKDNIYLRAAQSTGVLDFPSLEPALANLRCDSSGAGGTRVEACVTKVNVAAWQDASRKLKVDIAKAQGSEVLLQDLQVAQQALDALTAELNHQP
eukprot:jgi/Tetstr1/449973/TSEL_037026.t1